MLYGDTPITVVGNLVADPELRFTPILREFAISEGSAARNRRVDVQSTWRMAPGFGNWLRPSEGRLCPAGFKPAFRDEVILATPIQMGTSTGGRMMPSRPEASRTAEFSCLRQDGVPFGIVLLVQ